MQIYAIIIYDHTVKPNHSKYSNQRRHMFNNKSIIPASYEYLFDDVANKVFTEYLARYVLFDEKPITTPALWQDVAIYIRYKKRDVWSLSDEQLSCARYAIVIYQVKYITEHLKKPDILQALNQFFTQTPEEYYPLMHFLEKKLHASIDSLLFTQEKLIITKEMANDFDQIFAYPCWPEFTDEANQLIFSKILNGELSDEQIDYFLGASDDITHYDQWFKIIKHVLTTTHDSHVFWIAGDILSIIWKAIPTTDKKSQKWFRNQVFEIFWPRVGSVWPLKNEDAIDFNKDEDAKILKDSIGWLRVLDDLKERLPELSDDYETYDHEADKANFAYYKRSFQDSIKSSNKTIDEMMELFFNLADCAYNNTTVEELKDIAKDQLTPLVNESLINPTDTIRLINRAIKHAETFIKTIAHEHENLTTLTSQ